MQEHCVKSIDISRNNINYILKIDKKQVKKENIHAKWGIYGCFMVIISKIHY